MRWDLIDASFSSISGYKSSSPIGEYSSTSVVNLTFLFYRYRPRDTCLCNEKSACLINPVCRGAACCRSHSRCAAAAENPADRIPRYRSPSAISTRVEGFRQGLRENGYVEGQNIAIEYRWAEGKLDRLPKLAADLVSHKVDIIVTHGDAAIRALKQATKTIPIVVGVTGDLVVTGHAASLARPGGNITGFVDTSPDLSGKRLELLKEILPKVSQSLFFGMRPIQSRCSISKKPRRRPKLWG